MGLIKQGAEAKLFAGKYLGKKCVVKVREEKKYREKSLDERILAGRMRTECALLSRAKKAGVRTPIIWKIDFKGRAITTEYIAGTTLKAALQKKSGSGRLCGKLGREIAKLHSADIVHGDLTTSNVLLHKNGLVFLDFGLGEVSSKVEEKAVDLLSLKKTFLSTHFRIAEKWGTICKAYSEGFEGAREVLGKLEEAEGRARYY